MVSNVDDWVKTNKLLLNCSKTNTILIGGMCLKSKLTTIKGNKSQYTELNGTLLKQVDGT